MSKRLCILLAAIAIIGLQAAANSATLQAGWYVDVGYVQMALPDEPGNEGGSGASPVGTCGPVK